MVPPNLVKMPNAPTFCRVNVFCTAANINPADPVTRVAFVKAWTAFLGLYVGCSSIIDQGASRSPRRIDVDKEMAVESWNCRGSMGK